MITSVAQRRLFDFLPCIDLGKLRSFFRVPQRTRPSARQKRARQFYYVTHDGATPVRPDDIVGGWVYVTQEGKAVYWDEGKDKYAFEARYLSKTPDELFLSREKSIAVSADDADEVGETISTDDREDMLRDFYPKEEITTILASVKKLSGPRRPIPTEWRSKPLAWLIQDDEHVPGYGKWAGVVHASQDGARLMFTPMGTNGDPYPKGAYYLNLDPLDFVETANRVNPSPQKTPNFAGYYSEVSRRRDSFATPNDRAWVELCLKNEGGTPAPAKDITHG